MSRIRAVVGVAALLILVALSPDAQPIATAEATPPPVTPAGARHPVFAYYYIWFDTSSWNRAKTDYPALGRYSSDDPDVMRQQIRWAQSAGIEGFIVSWKSSAKNNSRLRQLVSIAKQEHFQLVMIYQGLDFARKPLPVEQVAGDFQYFRREFATDSVFYRVNGKPVTILSGTPSFSRDDIGLITGPVRNSLLVLSSEKSVDGYKRVADVTDGVAYYWSSVDPTSHSGYSSKLDAMSDAVHADGNLWIAPFAPGFDARKVGGSKAIERLDGQTLRTEYQAALQSSPDVLGLISWNEFSESTFVEPSELLGHRYLDVLQELISRGASGDTEAYSDMADSSSASSGAGSSTPTGIILLASVATLMVATAGVVIVRRQRRTG